MAITGPAADMLDEMRQLGLSFEEASNILIRFMEHVGSPKEELLARLNAGLRGEDPGKPLHWRGLGE